MAVVETYTKLEMSFIKITSILNQVEFQISIWYVYLFICYCRYCCYAAAPCPCSGSCPTSTTTTWSTTSRRRSWWSWTRLRWWNEQLLSATCCLHCPSSLQSSYSLLSTAQREAAELPTIMKRLGERRCSYLASWRFSDWRSCLFFHKYHSNSEWKVTDYKNHNKLM